VTDRDTAETVTNRLFPLLCLLLTLFLLHRYYPQCLVCVSHIEASITLTSLSRKPCIPSIPLPPIRPCQTISQLSSSPPTVPLYFSSVCPYSPSLSIQAIRKTFFIHTCTRILCAHFHSPLPDAHIYSSECRELSLDPVTAG
jgi:hypothetical protein